MARKLSRQQENRINANKLRAVEEFENSGGDLEKGLVICRYGRQADLEDETGQVVRCSIRKTVISVVSGDAVLWRRQTATDGVCGVIEAVMERRSELLRPDFYDGLKPVAANIDLVTVVASVLPEFSTNIIDRYLISCSSAKVSAVIVVNKADLMDEQTAENVGRAMEIYRSLGYEFFLTSTVTGAGIAELRARTENLSMILAGQSGVGKSSLLNALLEKDHAATCSISENSGLGQHTTTCTRLYHTGCGGMILDSPGVREFGLWHLAAQTIVGGYREFGPYLGTCRFKDCQHLEETGCGIKEAVKSGAVSSIRYENYVKIRSTLDLQEKRNRTRRANTQRHRNYGTATRREKMRPEELDESDWGQ